MRALYLIREALLVLIGSLLGLLLLYVSVQELIRPPGVQHATLRGMVPITTIKFPWALALVLLLLAGWLAARRSGGSRGLLWGVWRCLISLGLWWSIVGLVLMIGVVIAGAQAQPLTDLNWPFALASVLIGGAVAIGCTLARIRVAGSAAQATVAQSTGSVAAPGRSRWLSDPPSVASLFWLYAVFSLVCAVLVALRPLNFLADDSLFYLVIADYISRGHGSTFNGLFLTNGYHPLWEGVASGLALVTGSRRSLLTCGVLVQWAFGAATMWILLKALRPYFSGAAMVAFTALMLIFFVPFGNLYWTEAPLSMLFVALMLEILLAETPVPYVALGVVLGLLFLSRLDNVFLIGCVLLALWWRDRNPRIFLCAAVCAGVGGVYLISNLATFGHLMPISGAIKSALYRKHFFAGQLGTNGIISLIGAFGVLLVNAFWSPLRPPRYRVAMLALAAGVIAQSLYVVVMTYGETMWVWYYVQGYLCAAVLAAELIERLPRRTPTPFVTAGLAGCLVLCGGVAGAKYLAGWARHDENVQGDSFSGWRNSWIAELQRALPDDNGVLVAFDQPGLVAYALRRPIYSLDGLTSNYRVDAMIGARGMYAELSGLGTAYFMGPVVKPGESISAAVTRQTGVVGGQIIHFYTPLSGADAGCIFVDDKGLLLSRTVPSALIGRTWGVWQLTPATLRPIPCPNPTQTS